MRWDDLQLALAIGRNRSAAGAARALGVAPSTVYRRLDALEDEVGARFFDRIADGWTPTSAGAELLSLAEEVDGRLGAFTARTAGIDGRLEGEVRLTAPEVVAALLIRHLPAFRARHPRIRLSVDASAERRSLLDREVDVAIRAAASPPDSLVGRRLATLSFAACGARALGAHVDRLDRHDWVVFDDTQAHTPQGRWERANVADERVAARFGSRLLFLDAVRGGLGLGVLPVATTARDPLLVQLGEPIPELELPLWLLTHADLRAIPRIRAVMDFAADALATELTG